MKIQTIIVSTALTFLIAHSFAFAMEKDGDEGKALSTQLKKPPSKKNQVDRETDGNPWTHEEGLEKVQIKKLSDGTYEIRTMKASVKEGLDRFSSYASFGQTIMTEEGVRILYPNYFKLGANDEENKNPRITPVKTKVHKDLNTLNWTWQSNASKLLKQPDGTHKFTTDTTGAYQLMCPFVIPASAMSIEVPYKLHVTGNISIALLDPHKHIC